MVNITLNSSMRSNLLSLQNVSGLQDVTSNRLATGLKVNSAIDNPSSFYTAQSLTNRASDLNALLDSMSQGVQNLKAASEALESSTKFLQQAKAVANQAMEKTPPIAAKVSTEAELLTAINSGKQGIIVINADISMSDNTHIVLKDGQSLVGARYLDKNAAQTNLNFNFVNEAHNAIEVGSNAIISDLNIDVVTNYRSATKNGKAVLKSDGINLVYQNLNIKMNTDSDLTPHPAHNIFSGILGGNGELKGYVNIYDVGNPSIQNYTTMGINKATFIMRGNSILNLKLKSDNGYGLQVANIKMYDHASINVDTSGSSGIGWAYGELEMLSSGTSVNINSKRSSDFWSNNTGLVLKLTLAKGATIKSKVGEFKANQDISSYNVKIGNDPREIHEGGNLNGFYDHNAAATSSTDILFKNIFDDFSTYMANSKPMEKRAVSSAFHDILTQYNQLINDSSYKGVNLLKGDNLKINFNEDRSSDADVKGVDASLTGLGLSTIDWLTQTDIEKSITELDTAIGKIRSYASEFGNYYNIVSTRENFTKAMINVLEEGADKLTLADMNQESANMLALQTRQQLAVNSLSLANQASQSVLKLF